ncbi:MAG TPA: ATP-NAD kinase family protein [Methanoregulaceae archaeon]|nr:ATP-NAD kinase family protein [Methanoregulaceae archaeon]
MTFTIGFLVNPIAGMGGAVGLKGTDGFLSEAIRRGARPEAGNRALVALRRLKAAPLRFLSCSGPMGEDALDAAGITGFEVVYQTPYTTTSEDTRSACTLFEARGIDLILFCGGDGTARDVYDTVLDRIPILGIPAGVKMYSAVFAITPESAADIILHTSRSTLHIRDAEIVDVDEGAYRDGDLRTQLHGYARSLYLPGLVQGTKQVLEDQDEDRAKEGIGRFLAEVILGTPDILYLIGPGSTTGAIAREFGLPKSILGFDAVKQGRLVASDLNEEEIIRLLASEKKSRLIVSIIGAQGAVLGRGTRQVSPRVIRMIGIENIIVVATPHKLSETPLLFVDTGDEALDRAFGPYISVISGYQIAQRKRIGMMTSLV